MLKRNCKANVDKVGMQIPIKLTKQVQLGGTDTSIRKKLLGPHMFRQGEVSLQRRLRLHEKYFKWHNSHFSIFPLKGLPDCKRRDAWQVGCKNPLHQSIVNPDAKSKRRRPVQARDTDEKVLRQLQWWIHRHDQFSNRLSYYGMNFIDKDIDDSNFF